MASNEDHTILSVYSRDLLRFVKGLLPRADDAIAVAWYDVAINTVFTVGYDCLWRKVSLNGSHVVEDGGNKSSVVDIPLFSSTERYCSLGHIQQICLEKCQLISGKNP